MELLKLAIVALSLATARGDGNSPSLVVGFAAIRGNETTGDVLQFNNGGGIIGNCTDICGNCSSTMNNTQCQCDAAQPNLVQWKGNETCIVLRDLPERSHYLYYDLFGANITESEGCTCSSDSGSEEPVVCLSRLKWSEENGVWCVDNDTVARYCTDPEVTTSMSYTTERPTDHDPYTTDTITSDSCIEELPFSCAAARTYIFVSFAIGALLIIVIILLMAVIGGLALGTAKKNRPNKSTGEVNSQRYAKENKPSGLELKTKEVSSDKALSPGVKKPPCNDTALTFADETYDEIDIGGQGSPLSPNAPQIPIDLGGGENYDYVTRKISTESHVKKNHHSHPPAAADSTQQEPLPYEDFVCGGMEQDPPKQRDSAAVAVESSSERYSKLIHIPNRDSKTEQTIGYYNTKPTDMNRHSSHVLQSPTNEQEPPSEAQYSTLGGSRSPPPLPLLHGIENDPTFVEFKINVPENTQRESYYSNVNQRASVDMEELALHTDSEEVFYCNTAPHEDGMSEGLSQEEEEDGGDVLYDQPLNSEPSQELYMNVR